MCLLKFAITAILLWPISAQAWIHGGYTPGQTSINLGQSTPYCGQDLPFANFFKCWGLFPALDPSADTFDSNGYPTSATLNKAFTAPIYFMDTTQMTSATRWVIAWDGLIGGDATHGLSSGGSALDNVVDPGSCVKANGSSTAVLAGTNCIVTFTWRQASISPSFTMTAGATFNGTLNNLILARCEPVASPDCASTVAAIKASPAKLNPDYLALLRSIRPLALRFLNFNGTNNGGGSPQSMQTNFSDIVPIGYMSYIGDQFTAYNGTVTGGGTNNYVCASGSGCTSSAVALTEGLTIQAKFTNVGSSGTPRLCVNDINGCVATPTNAPVIAFQSQNGNGTVNPLSATQITSNSFQTLRYDSLLNAWISGCQSSCIPSFNGGVPPAAMVSIANEVNADLWYTVPCFATDAFITSVTTQILSGLNSSRNLIIEYANEVWNSQYACTSWASARGIALAIPNNDSNRARNSYYGLRTRQMAGLVEAAASALGKTNYRIVLANQFADAADSQTYRFNGTLLNPTSNSALCLWLGGTYSGSCSGAPDYSAAPNRPADHVHYGAYAPYYAGAQMTNFEASYPTFSGQQPCNNGSGGSPTCNITVTKGSPTTITMSGTPRSYSTGDRICTGTQPMLGGGGTAFTGDWAALNNWCFNITVLNSTQFTIPYDSSTFTAYSANAGSTQRFANQMDVLISAADQWAAGNYSAAWSTLDGDVRNGTNYGLTPTQANNNAAFPVARFSTAVTGYFPIWATIIESYTTARPNGVVGMQTAMYENAFEGSAPGGATFTATIDGAGTMTVSAISAGIITKNQVGGLSNLSYGDGTPITGFGYGIRVTGGSGTGGTGTYTLTGAGSLTVSSPTQFSTGMCGMMGLNPNYCGYDGKIANLLGINATVAAGTITPSANSYKMSSTFQVTVKYELDQFMAASAAGKAALPGWLLVTGGGQWSLLTGATGSTPFSSYYGVQNYHYPFLLKRDLDPASNDNDPMWLEKAS